MIEKYILDGHKPVPCENLMKWAHWMEKADRHVALTVIKNVRVSTVFLGINHTFGDSREPVLFKTMVFGGSLDQEMDRYSSWEDAEHGHETMVDRVKSDASGSPNFTGG